MNKKPPVCQFFLKGNCKFGEKCHFYHPTDVPMSSSSAQTQKTQHPQHDNTCKYFLTNSCTKNNKCEYFHGYCDRLQYVKTIGDHTNVINNLVNMDDVKYISSDNSIFYIRISGSVLQSEKINEEYKIGKLIFSANKVICAIQKDGM